MKISATQVTTPPAVPVAEPAKPRTEVVQKPNETGTPVAVPGQGQPAPTKEVDEELVAQVAEKMNQAARIFQHALEFEVAKDRRIVIRVIDTSSGEVIQEIPPEKMMETFKQLDEAMGLLIDRKV